MFKRLPFKHLPHIPNFKKISTKIALGVIFVTFFFNYQPSFSFPPLKQNVAHAQTAPEQSQNLTSKALDIVFQLPHDGYVSTYFSYYHPGIDLATPLKTLIHPVADGVVVGAGYSDWGYGLNVVIDHGHGYQSLYAHMGKIYVKPGDKVSKTDYLGEVGLTGNTTGPHTHLQISKDGINIDPLTILPQVRTYISSSDFAKPSPPSTDVSQFIKPIETAAPSATPVPSQTPTPVHTPAPSALQSTMKISQEAGIGASLPTTSKLINQLPL